MKGSGVLTIDLMDPDEYREALKCIPHLRGANVRLIPGDNAVDRRIITNLYWAEPTVVQVEVVQLRHAWNMQPWRKAIATYAPPAPLPVTPDPWDALVAKHAAESPAFLATQAREGVAE